MGEVVIRLSPKVLDIEEASSYLSISTGVFRKEVLPEVTQIKLSTRRRGYLVSDLDKWLEKRTGQRKESSNPWDDII
ncbi:helix-turn-helix transcriptional regulator [Swingsia samuiensis]|uniref:Transcriptional regulator n=1 Tax=Swingsia samuiensis TaxID=1293412 RepID=A0A4Y6ULC5_9PROT|nr:transcriptional regulator [Swingsia samuiensis]QDH17448.1 transcriptional regulator [Swingsia samuiensis]